MWNTFSANTTGGFISGSQNAGSAKKKKEQMRRVQSMVPLVISHIKKCKDEEVTLLGMPIQIVDIVGVLKDFSVQSTKVTCKIEDHSGSISAVLWLESDGDSISAVPPVKENCYVRVYGSIRTQEGNKMLMILKIMPVDDINVILHHHLLTVHARVHAEKLALGELEVDDVAVSDNNSLSFSDIRLNGQGGSGLKPIQAKILALLKKSTHYMGLSKEEILKNFPKDQTREVEATLGFLLDEGHAYTTCDNDHYKATDSL